MRAHDPFRPGMRGTTSGGPAHWFLPSRKARGSESTEETYRQREPSGFGGRKKQKKPEQTSGAKFGMGMEE